MKKAFTLVELIVVITVLGVLSTIGFVSYIWYTEDSRDWVRVANVNDIKKSLELNKIHAWDYPTPDNSYSVEYLGKEIWKQWVIGSKTKKHIKFNATEMDPKYDADYSYSVSSDWNRFEVGTILEDENNTPLSFLIWNTYASETDKAFNFGNMRWKFHVTKVNWETHVFSIPSMVFNNSLNKEIIVNVPTNQFSVTWEWALPESYVGKSGANETVAFTPRLLYRWANCWVETDQEIVNFIAILRDSFNYEPFLSNPDYKDIFNDYDILRNNMDDFETLKKLGLKINKLLDCNIKSFKTVDIFPTQCWYEWLNFEWVVDGFDIATKSCLFDYIWEGAANVQSGIWVSNTQWVHIDPIHGTWEFSYRVFTYTPMKFNFDYLPNFSSSSNIKFYINDVEYKYMNSSSSDYDNLTFKNFETPLLKPGLYDFKWVVYKYGLHWHKGELILDELEFTCLWGWNGCGWTDYEFEVWPLNPWDVFEFSGWIQSTWEQVDRGDGTLAIKSPPLWINPESFITKTITLDQPAKINFDMMTDLSWNGSVQFYIDDIEFLNLWWDGGKFEDKYDIYTTPLLPAWTYELKWRVDRYTWYKSMMWLDKLRFTCVWWADVAGNEWCGWQEGTFESWDINPWDVFNFSWIQKSYHWLQYDRSGSNTAIKRLEIPERGTSTFEKEITLLSPAKINFELFTYIWHSSTVKFYIDDNLMLNVGRNTLDYKDDFELYTSELLKEGTYQLRWEFYQSWWSFSASFDNFHLSCEWWAEITGNETCGWAESTLEPGNKNPWNNLIASWSLEQYEWIQTSKWDGTSVIKNNEMDNSGLSSLEKQITLDNPAKFNFKMKAELNYGTKFKFYINGKEYINLLWTHTPYDDSYLDYKTQMLPAWTYNFKWEIKNYYAGDVYMWLDSIWVNCINWWIGCWWDINNFDYGNVYPWTNFSFSGSLESYQWYQIDDGEWNNILFHTPLPSWEVTSITRKYNLSQPAKINFDIKTEFISNSQMRFYINDNLIYTHFWDDSEFENVFTNYKTTLLEPWIYDFKIEIEWDYRTNIWLDNFDTTCVDWNWLCGLNDTTFDKWSDNPWEVFSYSWDLQPYQWMHSDNGDGTYSLTNAQLPLQWNAQIEKDVILSSDWTISFDLKTDFYVHSHLKFFVDWVEQLDTDWYSSTYNNFVTFTTPDTFTSWSHRLKWEIYRYHNATNYVWLKNLTFN